MSNESTEKPRFGSTPEHADGEFYDAAKAKPERIEKPFLPDYAASEHAEKTAKILKFPNRESLPDDEHEEIPGVKMKLNIPEHQKTEKLQEIIGNKKNLQIPGEAFRLQQQFEALHGASEDQQKAA